MRLSVATNFDPGLVSELKPYPVVELFGKLREDATGGGRSPYQLNKVTKSRLAAHVREVNNAGMEFNYLLNSSCMGNREITRKGQREIDALLGWICKIGVSWVTLSSPFLLKLVKERYPGLKVRVSVFAGVDRVRKAQMWEEMGADCIVLDSILVNRELKTLEQIRKHLACDLELLANNNCLSGCALSPMHMNALSHSAQSWHENRGFFIDWCFLKCTELKIREPVNYIRSEWIRPEDIHVYESLGFDLFKITERDIPTEELVKRVRAYSERRFDGNLLDLIQPFAFKESDNGTYHRRGLAWYLKYVIRPLLVNPSKMMLLKKVADLRSMTGPVRGREQVFIDNRAMDGFMERFLDKGCRNEDCDTCRWCHDFAEKAVSIDAGHRREAISAYEELFRAIDRGAMWRYFKGEK